MKGYVYMINATNDEYGLINEQLECCDKRDLLQQVKMIANGEYDDTVVKVVDIVLVKNEERDVEKDISKSLYKECKKILKDRLSK